jgi:heme/copper-type cytochrome/quinol oxidase subunit 3
MHLVGLMGMPRRVYTYPDLPGLALWNMVETIGAFVLAAAVLVGVWNLWISLRRGQPAGPNPWRAWTLEWATDSPPPAHNFASLPAITSARPLYVPPTPPSSVPPSVVPGSGVPLTGTSAESVALPSRQRTVGPRISSPTLGILAFIFSEATFFGCLIAAYLQFRGQTQGGFGPEHLDTLRTALFSVALFASSATIVLAERRLHADDLRGFRTWLVVTIALGAVFMVGQVTEYLHLFGEGIDLGTNLYASSFFTLTGFHGLHVVVGLVMLAVVAGLALAGDFARRRGRSAVTAVSAYWHFVDGVWVVVFSLVYLLPLVSR